MSKTDFGSPLRSLFFLKRLLVRYGVRPDLSFWFRGAGHDRVIPPLGPPEQDGMSDVFGLNKVDVFVYTLTEVIEAPIPPAVGVLCMHNWIIGTPRRRIEHFLEIYRSTQTPSRNTATATISGSISYSPASTRPRNSFTSACRSSPVASGEIRGVGSIELSNGSAPSGTDESPIPLSVPNARIW